MFSVVLGAVSALTTSIRIGNCPCGEYRVPRCKCRMPANKNSSQKTAIVKVSLCSLCIVASVPSVPSIVPSVPCFVPSVPSVPSLFVPSVSARQKEPYQQSAYKRAVSTLW